MSRKSSFVEERSSAREANKEVVITPVPPVKEGKRGSSSQSSAAKNKKETKVEKEMNEKESRSCTENRSSIKKERKSRDSAPDSGLAACENILSEMEAHDDAWPFKTPVNTKQFPTYKKIIKRPMDMQSMRQKLESGV